MLLFWRHGYEGVSIGDLTRAIGVAPPSLYAAFGSKAGLYRQALARYKETLGCLDVAGIGSATSLPDAVRRLLEGAVGSVTRREQERGCMISSGLVACHPDHAALTRDTAARREAGAWDNSFPAWLHQGPDRELCPWAAADDRHGTGRRGGDPRHGPARPVHAGPGSPEIERQDVGCMALDTATMSEEQSIRRVTFLAGREWPGRFRATAANARTGESIVWHEGSGVPLELGVASSCALPQRGAGIRSMDVLTQPRSGSGHADVIRASQLQHAVERVDGDRHLGRPALVRARAQLVADHLLPPGHGGFDPGAHVVSGRVLPRHAPVLGDVPQVAVSLRGCGLGRVAGHGVCARRDNHGRVRMALGDAVVDAILVVAAVTGERRHGTCDLVEQGAGLRRVVHVLGGRRGGHDPAGVGVYAEMLSTPLQFSAFVPG